MSNNNEILLIEEWLSNKWMAIEGKKYQEFLEKEFNYKDDVIPEIENIMVAEMTEGDIEENAFFGLVTQWWFVNREGIKQADVSYENRFEKINGIFINPIIKILFIDNKVLIGETYAPGLIIRKSGDIIIKKVGIEIENIKLLSRTMPKSNYGSLRIDYKSVYDFEIDQKYNADSLSYRFVIRHLFSGLEISSIDIKINEGTTELRSEVIRNLIKEIKKMV